jgi:hypothetical protein
VKNLTAARFSGKPSEINFGKECFMATNIKIKRPVKPTVFLSHSSSNRRELLGLKRLLDERSGGLIEFFLSSDDDSIAHGTIWPAEVRAALDRMYQLNIISLPAKQSGKRRR